MHALSTGLLLALLAIGCGGARDRRDTGDPTGGGQAGGAAGGSGGAAPLSEADCERLLDHWFDLVIAEKKKTAKPEEVPTDEDVARARARLAASSKEKCVGSPRAPYDCSMKATTTQEIRGCLEGPRGEPAP